MYTVASFSDLSVSPLLLSLLRRGRYDLINKTHIAQVVCRQISLMLVGPLSLIGLSKES